MNGTTSSNLTPDLALDLDDAVLAEVAVLTINHPATGKPTSSTVTIAGPEHPTRKALLFKRMRTKRTELQKTGAIAMTDPEDDKADETALIADCTLAWSLTRGGQPLAFTPAAARELYADPRWSWLRDQVLNGLDARELFISGSAQA